MSKDPLLAYADLAACPTCGCLERRGVVRCGECGTFHAGVVMEERQAPDASMVVDRAPIDPAAYSLSGSQPVPDETFEESEEIVIGMVGHPISQWKISRRRLLEESTLMIWSCPSLKICPRLNKS